jgi:sodium/hydrogen antiporter
MTGVLLFAGALFVATLLSEQARRSVLSTAILFLGVGFIAGGGIFDLFEYDPDNEMARLFAELALFSVLFTDGMHLNLRQLIAARHLPGRALLLGMPLTAVIIALLARFIIGLSWVDAGLLAAVLSPTDPVFAAAIVGREGIPARVQRLLNTESGLNDGLALPVVLVLLAVAQQEPIEAGTLIGELLLGLALGVGVPWTALYIGRRQISPAITRLYEPFDAFAIELFVFALARLVHANEFIAAFTAGVTIATVASGVRDEFHIFGERVTELLKLATLLVFGALIAPDIVLESGLGGLVFALLVLVGARPLALSVALLRSGLNWRERLVASWFGPRGFASVVYGLLLLQTGIPEGEQIFNLAALVVVGSIIAHSSSDVLIVRWFQRQPDEGTAHPDPEQPRAAHEEDAWKVH